MEVHLVDESSFTPANPASYSLDITTGRVTRSPLPIDTLDDESTLTHQSLLSRSIKRTVPPNPTASSVQLMHNSTSKRVKVLELKGEKMILNEEADNASVTGAKQGKQDTNVTEPSKQDYIHVRARRGQATDSHSLAERARREKISERMKVLQDLVPGCNKIIGKALVLDEIINYVLSLQHQVEFLSMKLEAINSSVLPKDKMLPAKNLEVPGLDSAGLIFHAHPTSEYAQEPQSEGLPRQLGGNLERATPLPFNTMYL